MIPQFLIGSYPYYPASEIETAPTITEMDISHLHPLEDKLSAQSSYYSLIKYQNNVFFELKDTPLSQNYISNVLNVYSPTINQWNAHITMPVIVIHDNGKEHNNVPILNITDMNQENKLEEVLEDEPMDMISNLLASNKRTSKKDKKGIYTKVKKDYNKPPKEIGVKKFSQQPRKSPFRQNLELQLVNSINRKNILFSSQRRIIKISAVEKKKNIQYNDIIYNEWKENSQKIPKEMTITPKPEKSQSNQERDVYQKPCPEFNQTSNACPTPNITIGILRKPLSPSASKLTLDSKSIPKLNQDKKDEFRKQPNPENTIKISKKKINKHETRQQKSRQIKGVLLREKPSGLPQLNEKQELPQINETNLFKNVTPVELACMMDEKMISKNLTQKNGNVIISKVNKKLSEIHTIKWLPKIYPARSQKIEETSLKRTKPKSIDSCILQNNEYQGLDEAYGKNRQSIISPNKLMVPAKVGLEYKRAEEIFNGEDQKTTEKGNQIFMLNFKKKNLNFENKNEDEYNPNPKSMGKQKNAQTTKKTQSMEKLHLKVPTGNYPPLIENSLYSYNVFNNTKSQISRNTPRLTTQGAFKCYRIDNKKYNTFLEYSKPTHFLSESSLMVGLGKFRKKTKEHLKLQCKETDNIQRNGGNYPLLFNIRQGDNPAYHEHKFLVTKEQSIVRSYWMGRMAFESKNEIDIKNIVESLSVVKNIRRSYQEAANILLKQGIKPKKFQAETIKRLHQAFNELQIKLSSKTAKKLPKDLNIMDYQKNSYHILEEDPEPIQIQSTIGNNPISENNISMLQELVPMRKYTKPRYSSNLAINNNSIFLRNANKLKELNQIKQPQSSPTKHTNITHLSFSRPAIEKSQKLNRAILRKKLQQMGINTEKVYDIYLGRSNILHILIDRKEVETLKLRATKMNWILEKVNPLLGSESENSDNFTRRTIVEIITNFKTKIKKILTDPATHPDLKIFLPQFFQRCISPILFSRFLSKDQIRKLSTLQDKESTIDQKPNIKNG